MQHLTKISSLRTVGEEIAPPLLSTALSTSVRSGNLNSWMHDNYQFLKNRPINQIILPGTHDSGAYTLDTEANLDSGWVNFTTSSAKIFPCVKSSIGAWTFTQGHNTYEQLKRGIRCFDFGVSYDSDKKIFYITHTFPLVELADCVQQIKYFIAENPFEIVVITAKNDSRNKGNFPVGATPNSLFLNSLGGLATSSFSQTYGVMLSSGIRVVVVPDPVIPRFDTDDTNTKYDFLVTSYEAAVLGKYNILQFTITPTTTDIMKGIVLRSKNIHTLSSDIHIKFYEFIRSYPLTKVSCFAFDFPSIDVIRTIINLNNSIV